VDDSRLIRKIVNEILQGDPAITVAGYASNGAEALAGMDEVRPDLILLDWDMPVMTGGTALMHIMVRSPCPVVILSGFDGGEGATPFDLLCLGAVDFMRKPQSRWRTDGRADDLIRRVKQAANIRLDRIRRIKAPSPRASGSRTASGPKPPPGLVSVFVSGVGGAGDLIRTIPALPPDLPSAAVFLHDMQPEAFGAFVDYLSRRSLIEVTRVGERVELREGLCVLHPAIVPLHVHADRRGIFLEAGEGISGPAGIDSFLERAAAVMGERLIAGLFSGATGTGVRGLSAVKSLGGITVAQAPSGSVAPGMAEAALAVGAVDHCWDSNCFPKFFCDLVLGLRAGVGSFSTGGGR
jgi:two-component system chemotaxis response regulator CheB